MKLKKVMILLGTVCILNTMVTGCGSGSIAKTEENQTDEALLEELMMRRQKRLMETRMDCRKIQQVNGRY